MALLLHTYVALHLSPVKINSVNDELKACLAHVLAFCTLFSYDKLEVHVFLEYSIWKFYSRSVEEWHKKERKKELSSEKEKKKPEPVKFLESTW